MTYWFEVPDFDHEWAAVTIFTEYQIGEECVDYKIIRNEGTIYTPEVIKQAMPRLIVFRDQAQMQKAEITYHMLKDETLNDTKNRWWR